MNSSENQNALKAVIFDMDGVIINSESIHFKIECRSFELLGINVSDEEHYSYVGATLDELWKRVALRHHLKKSAQELTDFHIKQVLDVFSSMSLSPITGFDKIVNELKNHQTKIALASSSPRQLINIILNKLNLSSFFDIIVSGEEVERSKPAPDIFMKAREMLCIPRENCIIIEDSHNGVTAAKAAGIKCVGFQNPDSGVQNLEYADLIVHEYSELNFNKMNGLLIL